jgi:hypothetical protein
VEGNLHDTPLSSLLELIHLTKQSGQLQIGGELPLRITLQNGEVVSGGILDWQGLEAVQSFPLHINEGDFRFSPGQASQTQFSVAFSTLMTDWARINDEWTRVLSAVESPSRILEYVGPDRGAPHPFQGGKSIRAVAKNLNTNAFEIAIRVVTLLQGGDLQLTHKFAWMGLRIQLPAAYKNESDLPESRGIDDVQKFLNGSKRMIDLLEIGFAPNTLRLFLIESLRDKRFEVPGGGGLLRDLVWEMKIRRTVIESR